jgi:hypothetical protein
MIFTKKTYVLIAIAGVLIAGITTRELWTDHKLTEMERAVEAAKGRAKSVERNAAIQEQRAG